VSEAVTLDAVQAVLGRHLPAYRRRPPTYQRLMLERLRRQWRPEDRRVLDVGGGTGVVAQAVAELFPVDQVVAVDVADRFVPGLTVETRTFDGLQLPFEDGAFDCALFNNVLHHVPPAGRAPLLRECRRVCGGGRLYIKDHLAAGPLDHVRLAALDLIGNVPFGGMVSARYLTAADWRALAADAGYQPGAFVHDPYRRGPYAVLFPNRLEIAAVWTAV
jgi:SAM-dependent methyltransferase